MCMVLATLDVSSLYTNIPHWKKELTLFAAITKITLNRNHLPRQAIYGN